MKRNQMRGTEGNNRTGMVEETRQTSSCTHRRGVKVTTLVSIKGMNGSINRVIETKPHRRGQTDIRNHETSTNTNREDGPISITSNSLVAMTDINSHRNKEGNHRDGRVDISIIRGISNRHREVTISPTAISNRHREVTISPTAISNSHMEVINNHGAISNRRREVINKPRRINSSLRGITNRPGRLNQLKMTESVDENWCSAASGWREQGQAVGTFFN